MSETIHALRDIKAGEEIAISYANLQASATRRAHLKNTFGFDCKCSLCSLPAPELQKSDARRDRMEQLDEAIGDPSRVMNVPIKTLADCRELLRTGEEEYDGAASPLDVRLYYDVFQISITHSDQARASVFAKRAFEARIICEGEDSPETQNMKGLMKKPAAHRNMGISKKWKTTTGMVPKDLDAGAFEVWLWREVN